ncbi:MAG: SDR family oxidoreductase [SAR324 cluster bacterium]|nr:SDR family oxidoreductase [SAR324 cluster bacterium]
MKQVLILGATSDIAKALAHEYGREGYGLMLAAREAKKRLSITCHDLEIRYGVTAKAIEFDAVDFSNHAAFYRNLPEVPAIVVCVFGYLGDQSLAIRNFEESRKILETNYLGAVSILNVIANDFESRKNGSIIGISSVAGDRGRQSNYLYGSAKAGFSAYLSGLRNRLYGSQVHVMTVKPGFIFTKMTENMNLPPALTAQPDQVAKDIVRAGRSQRDVLYTRWFWRYIMLIICLIPESIFKRLKL